MASKEISRRTALVEIPLFFSGLILTTCGPNEQPKEKDTRPQALPSPVPKPPTEYPPEVYEYYSSIINRYPLGAKEVYTLPEIAPATTVINFSDRVIINPEAMSITYQNFSTISLEPEFEYRFKDNSIHFRVQERALRRILFVIPQDAPSPPYSNLNTEGITAVFSEAAISFIKAPITKTFALPIEACNASLGIGSPTVELEISELLFLQDMFCNSLGLMVDSKNQNMPYGQYVNRANKACFVPQDSNLEYPLIVFPEKTYYSIPAVGPAISLR